MRPFEACPFCNGEFMFDWINDTRRCNNCGALFTWRIIREPSGVPIDLTLQLKKAEDRITELKAENDELKERVAMLDVTAVFKSLGEMRYIEQVDKLTARTAELEAENERLSQLLHDEMSQLEIATDLGNKRWLALNDIYENGEKHNANWCKRKAQEGLGIK